MMHYIRAKFLHKNMVFAVCTSKIHLCMKLMCNKKPLQTAGTPILGKLK